MRLPSPRTLGSRVALGAALAAVLAAIVMAAVATLVLQGRLADDRDRDLRARAAEVARLAATAPALVLRPGALDATVGPRRLLVQVEDRRGRIVARSSALGARVLPRPPGDAAAGGGGVELADVALGDDRLRVLSARLPELAGAAGGGRLRVAVTTDLDDATLGAVRTGMLAGAGAAVLLAALAAVPLTRRALRPVRRLVGAARDIESTGDARARLPDPGTADEVGRLAATLNGMLGALERSRERERRFVADAAHELRTPLTALRGNAAYAAGRPDPEALRDIEADAARMGRMLDDLLALAREDAEGPPGQVVALDALVRAEVEMRPRARLAACAPAAVRGDATALRRLVANLIENGERHGPPGGTVTVEVRAAGGRATLAVRDEGRGIAAEHAERAFERFWRAPGGAAPGSGLGLAIVRATAERHGGRARAEGSAVIVELPRLPASETPQRRPVQPEEQVPTTRGGSS